jgi:hypothetical protein
MNVKSTPNNSYSSNICRSRLTIIKVETLSQLVQLKTLKLTYPKDYLLFVKSFLF